MHQVHSQEEMYYQILLLTNFEVVAIKKEARCKSPAFSQAPEILSRTLATPTSHTQNIADHTYQPHPKHS
jgi:hypothetical protein